MKKWLLGAIFAGVAAIGAACSNPSSMQGVYRQ